MIAEAVNAVRLHTDPRPFTGLTDADQGTLVERVISRVVLEHAVDANNRDAEAARRGG